MKFQNFKVEDENDNNNAGLTSKHSVTVKLKLKFPEKKFKSTTQSLENFLAKKLHSNDHAINNENDDVFHLPIKNVNKISTIVTSTSQTTNVNNGNGLELHTLFEPKEVITVTPVEVQSPLNFDDIFELPSSIVNDEDFTKSFSDNHYVTSSEKLTSEHKQQSNNETLTTIPIELFSVVEQTDNPSNTLSTLSSSNNDNGNTEKSDEFGLLETISFDQDLEEPAKITAFRLTSTSSTIPSSNTRIDKKLTSKELQNSDIITTNNENDEILYSTAAHVTSALSTVKTNSYDAEHSKESSLTTFLDLKLLQTDLTNTGALNFKTNNYEGNSNVVTHHPTNDGRVTVISESELTNSKLGTWPELTSKILDESMPKLSSVTDELLGGLPSKALTDENMAISNTGLKSTATFMEGNKESKKLQNILITTNNLLEETQVKENTNGEVVTSTELTSALAQEHGNLPSQIISETSLRVTSNAENLPLILQNTHKIFNYFKLTKSTNEDMIPTLPFLATEEDILSKILETTHYPFISNEFNLTTDENMILQELEKTIVSNFEVNTESSIHEKDTTAEKVENILMTKNNMQEGTQLNGSTTGDLVSEELEFTTIQTHTDENKDSLTSNELLTSSELTTMADNSPSILKIKDGFTITLSALSKEHDNVSTQIIGKIYEVTGDVEKTSRDRFNQFMIKKTTNEDMVSNVPLLATEIESLSHVSKTTHNLFIENKLKTTTDENMVLHELEKTSVSNFEGNTESSTVSALITLDEKDTTAETLENTLMTKNNVQEKTQLNGSTNGDVVSEVLEFSTFKTNIDESKDLPTSNVILTSSKLTTIADNFPVNLEIKHGTLSEEHKNVPTQIIGKIYELTGDVEKTTQNRFNQWMLKKITNEDMVSNIPVLTTESLSQVLKTTHSPFIENKLKTTTDENMILHELEKTIVSNFELNTESSTVSALVTLDETDTTEEKLENNILMTKSNSQETTQFSKTTNGDVVSEGLEFTTFKTHIDGNKDLQTSNKLLTSSEATSINDNFPSNLNIIDGTTITSAAHFQEHDKTSEFTEHVEKTTRDRFNEFMLKKTTNEDMVSNVPLLATEIESLSQVLKTTHNPFIENKLKTTTDENMILQELDKTIVSNFELNAESSTVSALITAEKLDSPEGTQLNISANGEAVSEDLKLTTFQTHIDENKDSLTSNELLSSSEGTRINDNFPSNLTIKDGTAITLSTLYKEHDNGLTQTISKTSEVTVEVEKTTRDRFSEFMLKKTTNEDMVSQPVLIIDNKLKVTTDENMILQEPEKITNSAGNIESLTTSVHVSQIVTATEILPNDITGIVKLPEENQFQESTNKKTETELAAVSTKNENESQVWPDLTTTVEIAPHILTKTTIGLFNEFQFKDTTAHEDMASIEPHSATTLTDLPQILKTTTDIFRVNQLNENMLSKKAELTTTMEGTTSNLLVTSQNIHTSEAKETTNYYVEGNKESSTTLNILPTVIEDITRSENLEPIVTDETHFKETADLISKEENMNVAAKLKGKYTNTMEVLPYISKTTNSLLKNFLVEGTTDEDMILQEPEKTSFQENKELPTESEHALETTVAGSLSNIVIATTKLSVENQVQETTNKFSENKILPDLTTTVEISSHYLTETTKNLFQEFQLEETTVNEDMTPIESRSTTVFTNLPHIFETTSKLFEEITNEDMVLKETELTKLTTTMEENNELLTSNVPITAEKIDTSEVKELQGSSTILNELLTLTEKSTESKNLENIPATTELTKDIQFKESSITNMGYEVPEITEIASHSEKNVNTKDETTITRQASEHISETTYNIFKIFEPQGSTDEDMAIIEPSILPEISKITPNVFLDTTNNEDMNSVDFQVITSTISAVENKSSNNIKSETVTLPILSSNIPNVPNIVTEPHEIIDQNKFKSKATEEISDLTTSDQIIWNTHTIGIGTSVESLPHSPTTIHNDLVLSKFTDVVKTLEPNTDNLSKTTHDINFSSTHFDNNLELSEKTNAYTETTKESSNLNKEQPPVYTSETNSQLSLLSSSNPFPEHNRTSIYFEGLTTKSYGNENGDWVTWPDMNSTSEKTTVTTLITKLTISDLLTTESSTTNEVTEIFQDVIALSTKSAESSSETFPTLPDELQLDFNQTPIEHSTNLSTIENSFVSSITPLVVKSTLTTEGYHFKDTEKTLHSVETQDQYTSSSPNTLNWKTAFNQMTETQLEGITSPNLILTTISVKTHEPSADNQLKTTQNSDFSSTPSDNNLESLGLSKEHLTSTSQSSLLSSSNRLQGKNGTFLGFEELTTKSYGNKNGDWITWPEINSTSDKNTVSTLLTKFTISDSLNTEILKFNDVTEIYQDVIALSTTSKESSSQTFLTLPDELQLGFNQTPIEDSTNLLQITTAKDSFESTATTLNINSFSTTERYHVTNNIITNYVSPIGIENTFHAFNTKDQFNDTDHSLNKSKFAKTTVTDILNVKSSGQMTSQFEHTLTIPDKIEQVQESSTATTINPLFTLTEGIINTNHQTEVTKTNIMHSPSEITDTYTSTLLNPTHVEHLSHSENLITESGNTLTLMISDEITQSNQASIGSTLANQNYQTEQHDTNLMHNSDESSETHASTLVKSTENSVILSHNQTLQTEAGNKLTSDLNLTNSFATDGFLATTLSTPSGDSKITENNFVTVSHEKVLEHTENTNNPTDEVTPHLELLDEEFMHFSKIGTHITTASTFDRTTPIIHATPSGDELLISHTEHKLLNTEDILAKQSDIIQNSSTTLGLDQGMVGNQIIHSVNIETQPLTTENAHSEFSESSRSTVIAEHGLSHNELTYSVHTESQPLTIVNKHPEFSESSHTTLSSEHGIPINDLTHSANTESQPLTTINAHPLLPESDHTTSTAEQGISHNELTHSVNIEYQSLSTANEHPLLSESGHITISAEHNELTHSVHTENQPLTNVNENLEFLESSHTTLSSEHGISINELIHSGNTENQQLATVNAHQHLPESGHTTISAEHEISHNELTHSVHTESQHLTNVNENPEFSKSSHTTFSSEQGISINDLTYSENIENQLLTTVNAYPHLPENGHPTISAEHELSYNELTHSLNTEGQPLTTLNENLEFLENSHITLSSEHGIPINDSTHSENTESQPLTTVNAHPLLPESDHTAPTAEQGISHNELTHSINIDYQSQATANEHPHLPESDQLTHSLNTEYQSQATPNVHPHLSENGYPTISAEHELSHNELTHSLHTEGQPLTNLNEHLEFSENSHMTLSSEHGIPINDLTNSANTESQSLTTANAHTLLPESDHTTPTAEQGLSHNELTHSINIEYQSQATANEPPHLPESGQLTHSLNTEYQSQATPSEHPQLTESGHTTISVEHELSYNELTHSVHTESQHVTNVNENIEFSESSPTTLSSAYGISINDLTHSENIKNQPPTAVNTPPYLSESGHTNLNEEQGISFNELTHSVNVEYQSQAIPNEHLPENGYPTISAEHELSHNELTHSLHTESEPLTSLNENLEFSGSSHITLSSEHGIPINDLTHLANTENQPLTTVNAHSHLSESDHTTPNSEQEISHNELSHSINIEYQSQATANEHPQLTESGHTTISAEHELSHNELTHSVHTESQPLASLNENLEFSESSHITLSSEHGIPINDLTHLANTENQPLTSVNAYPHLPESDHTTPKAEQKLSHNELTYSVHTENHPLTNVKEHPEFLESSHTTLSSEHGISINELTHSENTENQPLSTVSAHPHLSESVHTTVSAEYGISSNVVTHSVKIENQQLTTDNEHPHLTENGHPTISAEHELSHNELTHSVHTESQPLTTMNEHIEFSESSHTTLSLEHGISMNELTHLVNSENQPLSTINAHQLLPETANTALNAEQGFSSNELTHSVNTEHQTPTTENDHPQLSESVHTTISMQHELSHNELTYSVHTENHPLTNVNEHPEFLESSHTTLSSEHGISINEFTHSANTEDQPLSTVSAHSHLSESDHTTPNAEQGLTPNELPHSVNIEHQTPATENELPHLSESGHTAISAEHELSQNLLTHSVHTENHHLTNLKDHTEFSESSHTTLSLEHGISINELTHLVNTENQPLTNVNAQPHLSEIALTTRSAEHELSHNELTHSINAENHLLTTMNDHPEFSEKSHTTLSLEHGISINELTHSENTETVNSHPQLFESSHSTLSPEHELSTNELTHSIDVSHLPNMETQSLPSVNTDLKISDNTHISSTPNIISSLSLTDHSQHIHATFPAELEISDNKTSYSPTFTDGDFIKSTIYNSQNIHETFPAELEISDNETSYPPTEVLKSTKFITIEDITKHSETNQIDHTTIVPKLEILDEELLPFPSKPPIENTTYHTRLSTSSEFSKNVQNISHADLGVTNSELLHLLNTTTQLLSPETTEHQIADNLHTSFGSTSNIIHGLASNDIDQNIHTISHADLVIPSSELPHQLNTATHLLSPETAEHQLKDNLHTSFSSTPIISNADTGVINSAEITVFEDITKHSETDQIDHTTDIPKLEILDEELIQLPTKPLTENTDHTEPSILSDINQNKHTNFHADLGITSSELSHLVNTATTLLSTETIEHHIADDLHTSLGSTPIIINGSALNDIDQIIHTTSHADLGISSNELSHLVNTATTLLSTETIEHHIADDLHTSLGSTHIIINGSALNDIDQNIHTTSHVDLGISSSELSHLVNTATTLLSTESIEHHIADDLHTSLGSTPIIINGSALNDIDQIIHTTSHADLGISSNELSHLVNTATTLLSTETMEHHIADDLHTSLGSTSVIMHSSASNDVDQNIHSTSHADLGISSNELSHLVNTATTLLSTETTEHNIADNLHTSFDSTSIIINVSDSNDISQNIHTTFHADLGTSSSELQHLSNIATQLLSNENTDHQIPNNMHTGSITPTTFIFHSTESGLNNTEQGVMNSIENITKHSEMNQIDHTTDIPKLEILDEELIHLPTKLSTDHLEISGNELSGRPSTITKPMTSLNIVSSTSDNIPIGITSPSNLIVQNIDNEAKSNTQNKFAHLTENLANHSEVAHSNHFSTPRLTSYDLLNTENQQISDNHSSLVNPSTSQVPGTGNESTLFSTNIEFYNSTEFSVYEDLAKHLETTQINQTTVVPKLEILDEEFIQIPNKSVPLTEHINLITNHTDLTTLPVTFSEFIPLPTITLLEQMFSDFIHNTSNYTKPEEEELTTERLKSTLVYISNQNLNVSSEISKEHFIGTESSDISSILTTNTNLITNAFSHKETNNQFLKTHSTHSEFETLEFLHSTESFKENLQSFHEWLAQPTVNGTDQTTMFSNVNESTLPVKPNSDMEVFSTNDLKHFTTLTHSTVSYLPNITNENIFHTSQHHLVTETNEPTIVTLNGSKEHPESSTVSYLPNVTNENIFHTSLHHLGTETNEPTIFTLNGAKEHSENLNPNQQGLDHKQTLLPVITTSTFAYSQNYHNENFTKNEELPPNSVSREMMSSEITTSLPLVTTTSTVAYSHNYFPEDFSVNKEFSHASDSHVTTFPSSIISAETSTAKLETSPNLSTMQSLAFHNKFSSTEMYNLGNVLKTDQAGNIKNDSEASSTEVSEMPTHESIENLSKSQNKTSGDTFHSNNKNIDNNSSETSNLTINHFKTTGKEFEKNSTDGMSWQWPGMGPETSIPNSYSLAGDHAKITQPDVTIANAKFEPADNEILFTSKPNLSTTALEHVSISPNLVTHVTHPKLQPEMNKNIPPLEILPGQHNVTVGNTNEHQSNGKLQNAPIYINLPVYPVDSTYPLLLKFNEYYSSTTKSSIIIDDEATDKVINTEQFRTMKFEDFNAVTEFPSTTIKMEEPEISKLLNTNQILSNSILPTTALNQALKTDHIESSQQSVELTTTSEGTHVGKAQDKLPNALNENSHQNQQNAKLTTKSETVHLSSAEENINQTISTGVTEFATLGSSLDVTHVENTSCTSSNTLNKEIGSEEINKTTESSLGNAHSQPVMIISEFPKFQEESTCNYTDYLSQNNCMCSMDNLIKDLRMKLVNNFLNFSIDNFTCPIFTHVEAGIFLGNDSVPQISKSRRDILSDMYSIVVRREIVDYQNMDKTLNEQLELKNTENDIFATPGMKILIPCISTNNLSEGSTNYSWTFSDNLPLTEGKIQETEGTLTIDNVAPQDAGNYTCIATSSNANKSDEKRYEHHLSVVSIPSYRLQTTLLYNSTEKCQSGDADIISLYLPHSLEGLICGNYFKVCSIEVKNPKCLNATQYTSVNLTVIIEPINVIMPAINNSVCDVGCEMKIYTHVVLFIIKNLEAVLKLPVFFRLSYRQQKLMPTEVVVKKTRQKLGTEAPKLIITCPPGFGYYKKTHVCGTCGRNTFSRGDETFCSPCPAGQYQPMVGSKSCLICATPLQDPYCLRVMYSNTHKFRVLIGITATVLVVFIILLLCIKSMKKSTNSRSNSKFGRESYLKNRRQSKRRSREPDCEMQDSQPLLDSSRERKYKGYNRKPPEPPPPDFY